jgi:hypothetical protein
VALQTEPHLSTLALTASRRNHVSCEVAAVLPDSWRLLECTKASIASSRTLWATITTSFVLEPTEVEFVPLALEALDRCEDAGLIVAADSRPTRANRHSGCLDARPTAAGATCDARGPHPGASYQAHPPNEGGDATRPRGRAMDGNVACTALDFAAYPTWHYDLSKERVKPAMKLGI